jgi:hypothetical protein
MLTNSKLRLVAGLVALGGLAAAGPATAAVLTFGANSCSPAPCSDDFTIDQNHGDITGQLDVRYNGRLSTGASGYGSNSVFFYSSNYSGLSNVAYASENGGGLGIFLLPAAGFSVTLNSFQIGSYDNAPRQVNYTVEDASGKFASRLSTETVAGSPLTVFGGPGLTSTGGIFISFGPDAFNTGITNIDFTVQSASTVSVPGPIAGAGLPAVLTLGGLLWARRRKAAAAA